MGKMSAFLVSSLLLIPSGGFLAYSMILMFMQHGGETKMILQITAGIASLCGVTAALLPFAILIFMPSAAKQTTTKSDIEKPAKDAKADKKSASDDDEDQDESQETVIESAEELPDAESEDFETMDFESSSTDDDFADELDDFEDFDLDDDDEDEKPKSRKKDIDKKKKKK